MTTEARQPGDEARWVQLLEAEACGELSEGERLKLEKLAEQDEQRQQERRVLAEIAALAPLDPDLSADDERLIDNVLEQHVQRGRRRKAVPWLAAAVVFIPLAAAAAYLPWTGRAGESPNESAPVTAPAEAPSTITPRSGEAEPQEPEIVEQPEAAPSPAKPSAAQSAGAPGPPSAAELLAQAQKARSARNYATAIRAYQQLLRQYPASGEARLAQVSLAQLQLAQGNAAAALAGFDAYQRSGGALSQEAHYGKIQALRALGRTAEERVEIRRFLVRYPKSLQAATLKRRLGAEGDEE